MSDGRLFPICCTVEIPTETLDKFLKDAYADYDDLGVEDEDEEPLRNLTFVRSLDDSEDSSAPSVPPTTAFVSPFLGDVNDRIIADKLKAKARHSNINPDHFCILDEQTLEDSTVFLVEVNKRSLDTVRARWKSVQTALINIEIGNMDLAEFDCYSEESGEEGEQGSGDDDSDDGDSNEVLIFGNENESEDDVDEGEEQDDIGEGGESENENESENDETDTRSHPPADSHAAGRKRKRP